MEAPAAVSTIGEREPRSVFALPGRMTMISRVPSDPGVPLTTEVALGYSAKVKRVIEAAESEPAVELGPTMERVISPLPK
jgi:hypothetical protein